MSRFGRRRFDVEAARGMDVMQLSSNSRFLHLPAILYLLLVDATVGDRFDTFLDFCGHVLLCALFLIHARAFQRSKVSSL